MLREEAFLSQENIESFSGVTFGVTRPTKHASNPVAFPAAASSNQNYHVLNAIGGSLLSGGTTALAIVGAKTGFSAIVPTYATTTDGVTFTQPSLGLVTWAGSTANNVMHPTGVGDVSAGGSSPEQRYSIVAHFYHEDSAQWVALMRGWNTTPGGQLYTSPHPYGPWTLSNLLCPINNGPPFPQYDPGSIVQRPDGRWLSYGQKMTDGYPQTGIPNGYYAGRRRDLFVLLSDTTDPFGSWTNMGNVLTASAPSRQYYSATAWLSGETICVAAWIFDGTDNVPAANTFNGTLNRVHKIALYTGGSSGLTLTLVDDDWLPSTGSTGDWDGGEVLSNGIPLIVGDETRFYYAGDNATHHQDWVAQGNRRYMGLTTWGRNRLAYIEGPGEAILSMVNAAEAASLALNSSGTITVELLDADDQVIPGYSRTDSVPITADAFDNPVTWDDHDVTPADFKTVLVLAAGARAYYLTAADAEAEPPPDLPDVGLTLEESSIFTQTGTSITARALTGRRSSVPAVAYSLNGGAIWVTGAGTALFDIDGTPVDGETSIVLTAGVPLDIELGVAPIDAGPLSVQIGIPE